MSRAAARFDRSSQPSTPDRDARLRLAGEYFPDRSTKQVSPKHSYLRTPEPNQLIESPNTVTISINTPVTEPPRHNSRSPPIHFGVFPTDQTTVTTKYTSKPRFSLPLRRFKPITSDQTTQTQSDYTTHSNSNSNAQAPVQSDQVPSLPTVNTVQDMASLALKLATHHGAVVVMAASIRQQAAAAISRMFRRWYSRSPTSKGNAASLIEQRKQSLYAAYLEQLLKNLFQQGYIDRMRVLSPSVTQDDLKLWDKNVSNTRPVSYTGVSIDDAKEILKRYPAPSELSLGIYKDVHYFTFSEWYHRHPDFEDAVWGKTQANHGYQTWRYRMMQSRFLGFCSLLQQSVPPPDWKTALSIRLTFSKQEWQERLADMALLEKMGLVAYGQHKKQQLLEAHYQRLRERSEQRRQYVLRRQQLSTDAQPQRQHPAPSPVITNQDARIQHDFSFTDWRQHRRISSSTPDLSVSVVNDQSHMSFGPGLGFARNTSVINSVLIEAQAGLHPGIQLFATEDSDEKMDTSSPWLPARNAEQPSSDTVSQDNRGTHRHGSSLSPPTSTHQDNSRSHFELAPHEHPGLHSGNGHYEQWYQHDSSNGHSAGYKFSTRVDTKSHSQDTDSWGSDDHFSKYDNEDADNEDADASATDTNNSKEEANFTRQSGDY